MPRKLKIKKGLDLRLNGGIEECANIISPEVSKFAIVADDFPGIHPKLDIKVGLRVKEGEALWHDKTHVDVKVVAPVGGTITDIVYGPKRKLLSIMIEASTLMEMVKMPQINKNDPTEIIKRIKESGCWAYMRQLPYDIVPDAEKIPRDIFITLWDSAPLSHDAQKIWECDDEIFEDSKKYLQIGINALKKITRGKVYIGYHKGYKVPEIDNAEMIEVEGGFPSSLPSVLAANISPVNQGETVWLTDAKIVERIGEAIENGCVEHTNYIAVTGSEIKNPGLAKVKDGASIKEILSYFDLSDIRDVRIISGNVLTGENVDENGYLRFPYNQITVIPEGKEEVDFMGWASMSPEKMSSSSSFPSFFMRRKKFSPNSRINGSKRSMIMSGQYDRYIPMDIMAEYLIKAILAKDIERMEKLGIYEVTPKDFAAAEYADTSKLELQKIVRDGLDFLAKENGAL